jgi:diguanylate cyclase (GGDEF)-like protein
VDDIADTPASHHPRTAALVVARQREIVRDFVATSDHCEDVASSILTWVIEALDRCSGADPLHGHGADTGADGVGDALASLAPESVSCLREVMRRQVLDGLDPAEGVQAVLCITAVMDDLMDRALEAEAARLEHLAYLDPLTALGNRRAADNELRTTAAAARRYGRTLGVVVADLDGLKLVNDLQGHDAGDRMLRALADSFMAVLRGEDRAFRIGGDEFVLLLPETSADGVDDVMRRIRAAGAPSFSYGAAVAPADAVESDALLRIADQRLLAWRATRREAAAPTAANHAVPLMIAAVVLTVALVVSLVLAT